MSSASVSVVVRKVETSRDQANFDVQSQSSAVDSSGLLRTIVISK